MKILRIILCLMLAAALLTGAALAETYTAEWGDVTLNFEIDDSLRQPLDIFDAAYSLPAENPTDDQYDEGAGLTRFAIGYTDASKSRQYLSMEVSLDEGLSAFRSDRDEFSYPAKREDYAVEHDYMTHEEADQKAHRS